MFVVHWFYSRHCAKYWVLWFLWFISRVKISLFVLNQTCYFWNEPHLVIFQDSFFKSLSDYKIHLEILIDKNSEKPTLWTSSNVTYSKKPSQLSLFWRRQNSQLLFSGIPQSSLPPFISETKIQPNVHVSAPQPPTLIALWTEARVDHHD